MGGVVRRLVVLLAVAAAPLATPVAAGAVPRATAATAPAVGSERRPVRVISVDAIRHVGGVDRAIEALVAVYAGQDDETARRVALAGLGATEVTTDGRSAAPMTTPPLPWVVSPLSYLHQATQTTTFRYNPAGAPYAAEAAITAAAQAWTDVPTSSFTYVYGGTTSECVSVIGFCPTNGRFTVGWGHLPTSVLGITDGEDIGLTVDIPTTPTCAGSDYWLSGVAAHELGHVAGLDHATLQPTVMQAAVPFDGQYCGPQPNDADGLTAAWPAATSAVTGHVTDAASGLPLPGAQVRFEQSFVATTDAAGDYATTLPRGPQYLVELVHGSQYTDDGFVTVDDPTETFTFAMTGTFASLSADDTVIPEGGSTTVRVHLLGPADHAVTGTILMTGSGIGPIEGVAADDIDFDAASVPFALDPGDTDLSIPLATFDDGFAEGTEILQIFALDIAGTAVLQEVLIVSIADDEQLPVPTVTPSLSLTEGGSTKSVRVSLVGGDPRDEPLTVEVSGIGGPTSTATLADVDFHSTLSATIGPADSVASFPLSAVDDTEYEGAEQIDLTYHVLGQDLTSSIGLKDNDPAPPVVAGPFRINLASGYAFAGAGPRSLVDQDLAAPGLQIDVTVNDAAGVATVYARATSVSDGGVAALGRGADGFTVSGGFTVGGYLFVSGDDSGTPTVLSPSHTAGSAATPLLPASMFVMPGCAAGFTGVLMSARATVPSGFPAPSRGYIDVDPAPGVQVDVYVAGVTSGTKTVTQFVYDPFSRPFVMAKLKGSPVGGGSLPNGNVVAFTAAPHGPPHASALDFAGLTKSPVPQAVSGVVPC